jgi:hypothetical protein
VPNDVLPDLCAQPLIRVLCPSSTSSHILLPGHGPMSRADCASYDERRALLLHGENCDPSVQNFRETSVLSSNIAYVLHDDLQIM